MDSETALPFWCFSDRAS